LASNVGREQWAEAIPLEAHRLVTDIDPALEEQILDVPQRQREPYTKYHY
jgi:hypothetical protein